MNNEADADIVWDGRSSLTDSLERDYAAMCGDGWDLIWVPTSPLTTPFDDLAEQFGLTLKSETLERKARQGRITASERDDLQRMRNDVAIKEFHETTIRRAASKTMRHRNR